MGVEMRFTKWGGARHWHYPLEPLGRDAHGWWLGGRAGIRMRRGFEEPIVQPHDFVVLVPGAGEWIASFNGDGETDIAVYVDVTTRPRVSAAAIEAVDLDLDVVRLRDGAVRVLDEDEFAEHRVRYGYPVEVVERALATTGELVASITAGREPFGAAGAAWLRDFTGPRRTPGTGDRQ